MLYARSRSRPRPVQRWPDTYAGPRTSHDPSRKYRQAERQADRLHRGVGGAAEGREGRAGGAERGRQDHAVPDDHRRGAAGRGAGGGRSRRDHRLFQPGCRRHVGPQRRGRGDGGRRAGRGADRRDDRARGGDGRSGSRRRDGRDHHPLWRGAGAVPGARRLQPRCAGARGAERARLQPGDDGRRCRGAVGRLEDAGGAGQDPADAARCAAARRAEQPSRSRKPDLARGFPEALRGGAADDLA